MSDTPKYLEQFERVKRFYQRIKEIDEGRTHDRLSDFYYDVILMFFMNCHHLKDWIKNDESLPGPTRKKAETIVTDNECLRYCADIANGVKHLKLAKTRRFEDDIQKGPTEYKLDLSGDGKNNTPIISAKFTYIKNGQVTDAFTLATQCLQKWEELVQKIE
ncbi:MAG: hypothetical protein WCK53_11285 [Methanomicrobiales archaeon]